MLRVGIIGLGTISYIHQLGIEKSQLGELVAVCDTNSVTKQNYPKLPFYTDFEEMLEKENLDVVHICLPHDLHVPIAKVCIKFGVHVFVEKPLSLTYEEGQELSEVVASSKYKLGVCFQNRYNRTTEVLVNQLKRPESGKIEAVKGIVAWFRPESYYDAQPWRGEINRAGGGTIINQSIHTLDLIHLFGGSPQSCKGQLLNLSNYEIEVEDTAVANYELQNEATGLYFATNTYTENSSVELEVLTSKKRFVIKDFKLFEFSKNRGEETLLATDDILEGTKSYYGPGHLLAIKSFYEAVIEDTDTYISIDDALGSMLMIDLLKESSNQNRRIKAEEFVKSGKA